MGEERRFELRMVCQHAGEDNEIESLDLEMRLDGVWQAVEVTMQGSSPYRVFLFSLFLCQNSYLYMNATERGLLLADTRGEMILQTTDFRIEEITANFNSTLRSGEPSRDDAEHICRRMLACPVGRNLGAARKQTTLSLGGHEVLLTGEK
jgi:hypothetical protein